MEEAVQALLDEGALARNGEIKLLRPLAELKIPPTVQAVLAARIDRLPVAEKELLQTLAVIGKDLALSVIEAVAGQSEERLEPMLTDLQLGEFIYEQPSLGGTEYTFKHALTQEVAYNSLLAERRRVLHAQTARAIETIYSQQLEDRCISLFRHYNLGNDLAKALRYAQMTAEQALNQGTYPEATGTIEAALELLNRLPNGTERRQTELALRDLEGRLAFVLYGGGSRERERAVRRACELGEKLGGGGHLLPGLIALSNVSFNQGDHIRGLELARRCVEVAETSDEPILLVSARESAGILAHACGKFREATSHLEAARQSSRHLCDLGLAGIMFDTSISGHLAQSLQLLGRLGDAVRNAEEVLRRARESRHLVSLDYALILRAGLARMRREVAVSLACAREAITLSEESGFPQWLMYAQLLHGQAMAELGELEQGVAEMNEVIGKLLKTGGPGRLSAIAQVAYCYARMHRTDEALVMLNDALAQVEPTGEKYEYSEILRLKGEVLLMHHAAAVADTEACFRAALDVARTQEARWWELRTSVSLARLLRDTNRRDEARTMLAEIYNWFNEGFDLLDLKEARTLLEKLEA